MIFNSFKLILRNLYIRRYHTLINVLGLAIGIASIVWGYQTYRFSFSFDNFHADRDHIFRVITKTSGQESFNGFCPLPVGPMAKNEFSSVKEFVRIEGLNLTIKSEQEESLTSYVSYTDPAFFDFFNFPVLSGSNDIKDRASVLLTEQSAKRFFGSANPIGQTLLLHAGEPYQQPLKVNGVLKDPPINSSIQFDVITNFNNYIKSDSAFLKSDDWNWLVDVTFLKIPKAGDAARLSKEFAKYLPIQNSARKDIQLSQIVLEPLSEIASHDMRNNILSERPEDSAAYGPLVLAILILISSCLNFANTTVSQSSQRLKEMGVRKVLGGTKAQLIRQQLMECGVMVILAILISVLMNYWWFPVFNKMFDGIKISTDYLNDSGLIKFLIFLVFFVTVIAGLYPAYYVSRYNATQIFRGSLNYGGTNLFSRVLLGLQMVVAFITIIAGFAFSRNSKFQKDFNFGFNMNNIIGVQLPKDTYEGYSNALKQSKSIDLVAGTRGHIGFSWRNIALEAKGEKKDTRFIEVGDSYDQMMGLKMVQGRWFEMANEADIRHTMVISENAAAQFGWTPSSALGQTVRYDTINTTVIGVVKDLYMTGLFDAIEPVVFSKVPATSFRQMIIRSKPDQLASVFDEAKAIWTGLYPMKPFNAYYQNELAAEGQKVNESIATIFFWFAIISALLTATGMFALISLTVLKKMKEIAIRRVVGASAGNIVIIVNKSYFWIFLVASFLGIYGGYALTKLLMDLIFKINIGVNGTTVLYSILGVCLLVTLTMGIKIWHTLSLKPTQILKSNQ